MISALITHHLLLTLILFYIATQKKYKILNNKTNIDKFNDWIERNINLNVPIKTGYQLDDVVESFNNIIRSWLYINTY